MRWKTLESLHFVTSQVKYFVKECKFQKKKNDKVVFKSLYYENTKQLLQLMIHYEYINSYHY